MLLKNKTAVVTGCNRGIGKKILEVLLQEKYSLQSVDLPCSDKPSEEHWPLRS